MPAVYLAGSHKAGLFVRNKTALISLRSGLFSMRLVTQSFNTQTALHPQIGPLDIIGQLQLQHRGIDIVLHRIGLHHPSTTHNT